MQQAETVLNVIRERGERGLPRYYAGRLQRSSAAKGYLASRGVGMDAALRLGLGFAPGDGLREAVESSGFTAERLRDSGLFT